jgi:hypothetical protein
MTSRPSNNTFVFTIFLSQAKLPGKITVVCFGRIGIRNFTRTR